MTDKGKKCVILFKKLDTDTIDQYNELFTKHQDYIPHFIPVLSHKLDNIDSISKILLDGPCKFNALILTSQRSVQAMSEAYQLIHKDMTPSIQAQWNNLPLYIVGPHTAEILLGSPFFHNNTKAHWTIAPRAAELIEHIIQDQQQGQKPLLFLAGDKRRDLIPAKLKEASIDFNEIQSYVTCVHPDLSDALKQLQKMPDWVVYFSPSGLKFLQDTPTYKSLAASVACKCTKIAAIGPTTADYITDTLDLISDVVAEKPEAQHLINAIIQFDASSSLKKRGALK
jgi:uroporphyrinogen-III synthase